MDRGGDTDMLRFGLMTQRFSKHPGTNMTIIAGLLSGVGAVGSAWDSGRPALQRWVNKVFFGRWHTHTIEFQRKFAYDSPVEDEDAPRNKLLVKALTLYVAYLAQQQNRRFPKARVELHAVGREEQQSPHHRRRRGGDKSEGEDKEDPFAKYRIAILPKTEDPDARDIGAQWTEVAAGVQFSQVDFPDEKDPRICSTRIELRSKGAGGDERVRAFVKDAWAWYKDEMRKQEEKDDKRYLYMAYRPPKGCEEEEKGQQLYKRFPLADRKTFDAFFHHEKEPLMRLINNFQHRREPFCKAGFPYKLGILLHGPPGTGKTTFIKCLSAHTKRNIVTVNLAKIKTNQELADIMFDRRFKVIGEDEPRSFEYNQLIFVLEDIDAASDVVKKRKGVAGQQDQDKDKKEKAKPKESAEDMAKQAIAQLLGVGGTGGQQDGGKNPAVPSWLKKKEPEDKLNLSGLLNALDGVVDTPGRIVVMTTNVVSELDPALIRPGRINKVLEMGHMKSQQVADMSKYYLGSAPPPHVLARPDTFREGCFTPAEVEQYCAECSSADELSERMRQVLRAHR